MPFLRFSRDKRGYEHVYLVHASNRRGKPIRPRLLYWYRTPPGIKVGRQPFDEEVRRALEAQNPGVIFDWKTIVSTPMPPPEPEHWRERRRAERAAKQARLEEDVDSAATAPFEEEGIEPADATLTTPLELSEEVVLKLDAPTLGAGGKPDATTETGSMSDATTEGRPIEPAVSAAAPGAPPSRAGESGSRRRRRRGGRRRRGRPEGSILNPSAQIVEPAQPVEQARSDEPFKRIEPIEPTEE